MSLMIYQQCTSLAIIVVLLIATYYDCKDSTIPIYLFPVFTAIIVPTSIIYGQPILIESMIGLLIGTVTFLGLAIFFDGGGADIMMMGILGWCLGVHGIVTLILISSAIYTIFATGWLCYRAFIKKEKGSLRKQFPFAPFVLSGYIICLLFGWLL